MSSDQDPHDDEPQPPLGIPFSSEPELHHPAVPNDFSNYAFIQQGLVSSQRAAEPDPTQLSTAFNYMYLDAQSQTQRDGAQEQINMNYNFPAEHVTTQYPKYVSGVQYRGPPTHIQHHPYQIPIPQYALGIFQSAKQPQRLPAAFQPPYFAFSQHPSIAYSYNVQPSNRPFLLPNAALQTVPAIRTNFDGYPKPINPSSPERRISFTSASDSSPRAGFRTAGMGISIANDLPIRTGGANDTPRGPPRKPRQSGFALWVGNIPPGTNVVDLKDHFSKEATRDIESVKLISKSNCAFVNYRTEEACSAAITRFQELRFQGTKLVCRLRRGSTAIQLGQSSIQKEVPEAHEDSPVITGGKDVPDSNVAITDEKRPIKKSERYFVLKSLTLQDLETSVRSGTWATQAHNEEILNDAYNNSDMVYLIFSANKSGEYFGFARMASPVSKWTTSESLTPIENYRVQAIIGNTAPLSIPTPATEWAPKGHIIDDSARGTIFWEAEDGEKRGPQPSTSALDNSNHDESVLSNSTSSLHEDAPVPDSGSSSKATVTYSGQGTPFRVDWISTRRLPFYRTKGLRNAWNGNREVKIARDGTELAPAVGKRLISLFTSGPTLGQ